MHLFLEHTLFTYVIFPLNFFFTAHIIVLLIQHVTEIKKIASKTVSTILDHSGKVSLNRNTHSSYQWQQLYALAWLPIWQKISQTNKNYT